MLTTNRHLPSPSPRIKSCAAAAADFQWPLEGVYGGEQKCALFAGGRGGVGELAGEVFIYLDIFRTWFYVPNSCISSYLENH